jgi:hypothetical protein
MSKHVFHPSLGDRFLFDMRDIVCESESGISMARNNFFEE